MNKPKNQAEWLAGNAVTAFVGALLMALALQLKVDEREVSFIVKIPAIPDFVIFAIAAFLLVSAFALGLASIAPIIQSWTFRLFSHLVPLMWLIVLTAFTMSWLSVYIEVREDPFLQPVTLWGGFLMFIFISYTSIRFTWLRLYKSKPNKHGVAEPGNAPRQTSTDTPSQLGESCDFWITASAVIALVVIARVNTRHRAR